MTTLVLTALDDNGNQHEAVQTRKQCDAHFAYCETCDIVIEENPYWSLSKSVWLHRNGMNLLHRVVYMRIES